MSNILVYSLEGKIYINLTNRCTNDCIFCLRKDKDDVCGQELWLDSERIDCTVENCGFKNEPIMCRVCWARAKRKEGER